MERERKEGSEKARESHWESREGQKAKIAIFRRGQKAQVRFNHPNGVSAAALVDSAGKATQVTPHYSIPDTRNSWARKCSISWTEKLAEMAKQIWY